MSHNTANHTGAYRFPCFLRFITVITVLGSAVTTTVAGPAPGDKHYNDVGFFDVHVCNWPNRPPFLMPLLSSARYDEIEKVEIFYPDGRQLTQLDLSRFRTLEPKDAPKKQVFINQVGIPDDAVEGWYTANVKLKNGEIHTASDYVVLKKLGRASGQNPGHEELVDAIPEKLSWDAVPGAGYYQVFIRDQWEDNKLVYTSKLLTRPELILPPGLIDDGGFYSWLIHARDINEDIKLGDFNSGSLTQPVTFSVDTGN